MAFCHPVSKIHSPSSLGHRTTPAMLEAKQSLSCHHLSLTSVEAGLKAADIKVMSSKPIHSSHKNYTGRSKRRHEQSIDLRK